MPVFFLSSSIRPQSRSFMLMPIVLGRVVLFAMNGIMPQIFLLCKNYFLAICILLCQYVSAEATCVHRLLFLRGQDAPEKEQGE